MAAGLERKPANLGRSAVKGPRSEDRLTEDNSGIRYDGVCMLVARGGIMHITCLIAIVREIRRCSSRSVMLAFRVGPSS